MRKLLSKKLQKSNSSHESVHHSFKRTYREEIPDTFEVPGFFSCFFLSLSILKKNWKIFVPLIAFSLLFIIIFVGLLSESNLSIIRESIEINSNNYSSFNLGNFAKSGLLLISTITTAGLSSSFSDGQSLILISIFLVLFLTSVFICRKFFLKDKISLRETLYTSLSPLLSTLVILLVILVELLPIFILVIFYSAALSTNFLSTPFYALIFVAFAGLMILLSAYLTSGSALALVISSIPGMYPLEALKTSKNLIEHRRTNLFLRLIEFLIAVAFIFVIVMLPVILLDSILKSSFDFLTNIPVVSFFLLLLTCFSFILFSVFLYVYYHYYLEHEREKNDKK